MILLKTRPIALGLSLLVLVLAATSCEELHGSRIIKFKAVTQETADTKASYSGILSSGKERIDWAEGDQMRIFSDKALCSNDPDYHWADYTVTAATASSEKSLAEISVGSPQGGLSRQEGIDVYRFFGVYPKPDNPEDRKDYGVAAVFMSGEIPVAQSGAQKTAKVFGTANTIIYYPSNAKMYMAASTPSMTLTESTGVSLSFQPAFTAFHIRAGADADMTIMSVQLSAETNPVAGEFTGTCNSASSWEWIFETSSSNPNKAITFTPGSEGYRLEAGKTVDMVLLALPTDLTGLTLTFNVKNIGDKTDDVIHQRKLELKVAQAASLYGHDLAANDWIIFNACKQAYLTGLIIPGWDWNVDGITVKMQESVDPWDYITPSLGYGSSTVVNASKLTGPSSGSSNDYSFSIYAPLNQQWKITVLNAPGGSTATGIHITQTNAATTNEGDGILTGQIGVPAKVDFTLSGTPGTYYLSFSVVVDDTEYSINSEVARTSDGGPKSITLH